ncbi:hypothetical protein [Streptosporangium sp. NPDC049644]|uniref:hypothetical protein n=1 Tax=Streptosporangium sp. NPDC049644 TaxID=3155507 RepID=UPI00344A784E
MSPRPNRRRSFRARQQDAHHQQQEERTQKFLKIFYLVVAVVIAGVWNVMETPPAIKEVGIGTGLIGIPGTLTILECTDQSTAKFSRRRCDGDFVYASTGEHVTVRAFSWGTVGEVYPARIADGQAGYAGARGALAALLDIGTGLLFLGLVPATAGSWLSSRVRRGLGYSLTGGGLLAMGVSVVTSFL